MRFLLILTLLVGSAEPIHAEADSYLAALTDRSGDIGVPSEGYADSPYTVDRDVWPGTSLNARAAGNERYIGGTFWLDRGLTNNNFTNDQYWDGKAPFRITAKNTESGTGFTFYNYNDFALEDDSSVVPNAALKLDHLTLYSGGFERQNFYARGNKFVIGEGISTISTTGALNRPVDWRIYGGTEHNRDLSGDGRPDYVTNVVVESGNWNYVFGGGEGATGTGTQVTVRGDAYVQNVYGGGERKGSIGVDEPIVNGNKGNPNNPGINVFIEGGMVDTLYGGSAINGRGWLGLSDTHALVINEDIRIDVDGGFVDRLYGGDDTRDGGDGSPVDYSTLSESPINGDLTVNLYSESAAGSVGGDMNRNVPRAATDVRQVRGLDRLNIYADQELAYMELFDLVNIEGANVVVGNAAGVSFDDENYNNSGSEADGYLGQIAVTNGGRLELTQPSVINRPYAHYNTSGSWDRNYIEPDKAIKASANHDAYYLRHGWIGETSEERRGLSVLAIDGESAGITAASGDAFDDSTDVCGLLIHGSVGGSFGGTHSWNSDVPGYSTLEVLGEPIYSSGDDYYYYVISDGSASNRAGTTSTASASANGGAAFREPEGADYMVCYRYLEGGKIGWYLREKPEVSAENALVHIGDAGADAQVTVHVEMNGFCDEWSDDATQNHVGIRVVRSTGSEEVTDTDDESLVITPEMLAGIDQDDRFSNVVYYDDGTLASFDLAMDQSQADDASYYEVEVVFEYDDERVGAGANCARCVYDIVNTTGSDAADYQESVMTTTPYEAAPQGADESALVIRIPYGCTASALEIGEDDGSFIMTDEDTGTTLVASLHSATTVQDQYASATSQTANAAFAVEIGSGDLADGITEGDLAGICTYPCIVSSYQKVTRHEVSNVRSSVIVRDPEDAVPGNLGETDDEEAADGLVLVLQLTGLARGAEAVGGNDPSAVNYGELRIRAVPLEEVLVPPPTGLANRSVSRLVPVLLTAMAGALCAGYQAIRKRGGYRG